MPCLSWRGAESVWKDRQPRAAESASLRTSQLQCQIRSKPLSGAMSSDAPCCRSAGGGQSK